MANITFSLPPKTIQGLKDVVPKRQMSAFAKDWIERGITLMKRKRFLENREKMRKLAKKWAWDKGPSAPEIVRKMRDSRY